ncbi:tail sheath protein [Escherichia coli]|nr:tail sheath protein [Escherichia coli]
MAQDYHHGVRVVEVNEGTRSITDGEHRHRGYGLHRAMMPMQKCFLLINPC